MQKIKLAQLLCFFYISNLFEMIEIYTNNIIISEENNFTYKEKK